MAVHGGGESWINTIPPAPSVQKRSLLRVHTKNKDSGTAVGASGNLTRSITTGTTMTGTARGLGGRGVMTKPTWTLLPDVEDPAPRPCTVEQMQIEYLQEHLGLTLWAALQEAEDGIRP